MTHFVCAPHWNHMRRTAHGRCKTPARRGQRMHPMWTWDLGSNSRGARQWWVGGSPTGLPRRARPPFGLSRGADSEFGEDLGSLRSPRTPLQSPPNKATRNRPTTAWPSPLTRASRRPSLPRVAGASILVPLTGSRQCSPYVITRGQWPRRECACSASARERILSGKGFFHQIRGHAALRRAVFTKDRAPVIEGPQNNIGLFYTLNESFEPLFFYSTITQREFQQRLS